MTESDICERNHEAACIVSGKAAWEGSKRIFPYASSSIGACQHTEADQ